MLRSLIALLLMMPASLFARPEAKSQAACAGVSCAYLPVVVYSPPVGIGEMYEGVSPALTLWVVGEVYNLTQSPVYDVTVEVRAYDDENHLIDSNSAKTAFYATLPGHRNPFDIWTNFEHQNIKVVVTGWITESEKNYQPAMITIDEIEPGPTRTEVSGRVTNNLDAPLADVQIAVWSLKQEGSIRYGNFLTNTLQPGQTITYTESLFFYGGPGLNPAFKAEAQGVISPTLTLAGSAP